MAANSKIEWTDHTFNPWVGCAHKLLADGSDHPACVHCYAEAFTNFTGFAKWGEAGTRTKTSEKYWRQPLAWNAKAVKEGIRRRVFCASFADVFEEWTGPLHSHDGLALTDADMRLEGFAGHPVDMCREDLLTQIIDKTSGLDWLLLTKRPENIRRMWPAIDESSADLDTLLANHFRAVESRMKAGGNYNAPAYEHAAYVAERQRIAHRPNVWLGTSISDQATAEAMIPELLACHDLAPVRFLSIEPLLGPVNIRGWLLPRNGINWVIAGGESGHHARPMHPDWARSIRDQCQAAGVPFFFKQWGEWVPQHHPTMTITPILPLMDPGKHGVFDDAGEWRMNEGQWTRYANLLGQQMYRVGKLAAGRILDGREWNEYPQSEVPA